MLVSSGVNSVPPTSEVSAPIRGDQQLAGAGANHEPPTSAPEPPTPAVPLPDLSDLELQIALATLTEPSTPPFALAAALEIHPADFLQILARPHVQQWIQAALDAEALQQHIVESRARTVALQVLTAIAADPEADPVERRRAAAAILRRPRATRDGGRPLPRHAGEEVARSATGEGERTSRERSERSTLPSDPSDSDIPADPDERAAYWARNWTDHLAKLALIEEEAADLREGLDLSSEDAAAVSITGLLAGANPNDPDGAVRAIWLLTSDRYRRLSPEAVRERVQDVQRIGPAAGAEPISIEAVGFAWYKVAMRPRSPARGGGAVARSEIEGVPQLIQFLFQLGRSRDGDYCHIGGFHIREDATPWRQDNESRPIPLPRSFKSADDDRPP
ncbi:MAG: hypothetical protein ACF8R7_14070 [Phycisphaerales bacterium JB039]